MQWVAIGVGAAVAVAGAVYVSSQMAPANSGGKAKAGRKASKRPRNKGGKGQVGLDKLLQMFDEIIVKMTQVKAQLDNIKKQIKRDAAAKGQRIADAEIDQHIAQQFGEAMKGIEANIYESHKVKQEDVEKATVTFKDDKKYQEKVQKLQKLFDSISSGPGGEPPAPPVDPAKWEQIKGDIKMETVIEAVEKSMDAVNAYVRDDLVKQIKAEMPGVPPQHPKFRERFYAEYQKNAPLKQSEVLDKYFKDAGEKIGATSLSVFQMAIAYFQNDPSFTAALQTIERKQQQQAAQMQMQQQQEALAAKKKAEEDAAAKAEAAKAEAEAAKAEEPKDDAANPETAE